MPLQLLIPSLLRASGDSPFGINEQHPLHALLDPLLLTPRSCTNKYHTEVPQILADEGGAGDIEEGTMWFALGYEKGDEQAEPIAGGFKDPTNDAAEPWKKKWLERMERREVQIQILLHFLVLSLPGPHPAPTTSPKKRKRATSVHGSPSKAGPEERSDILEARLESFMDKLSTWQLLSSLDQDQDAKGKAKEANPDALDWMQTFCRDIVEPHFKSALPELTDLLRSKLFPDSPFSSSSRSTSPASRSPSPFSWPTNPRKRSKQDHRAGSKAPQEQRETSRARSLSISLAEDRMSVVPGRKKLSREVSMSRVFKPKPKPLPRANEVKSKVKPKADKTKSSKGTGLGVTLVAATPVKNRSRYENVQQRSPTLGSAAPQEAKPEEDDDELLLGGDLDDSEDNWDVGESVWVADTPTKKVK